jgi:hypothetical protein
VRLVRLAVVAELPREALDVAHELAGARGRRVGEARPGQTKTSAKRRGAELRLFEPETLPQKIHVHAAEHG